MSQLFARWLFFSRIPTRLSGSGTQHLTKAIWLTPLSCTGSPGNCGHECGAWEEERRVNAASDRLWAKQQEPSTNASHTAAKRSEFSVSNTAIISSTVATGVFGRAAVCTSSYSFFFLSLHRIAHGWTLYNFRVFRVWWSLVLGLKTCVT